MREHCRNKTDEQVKAFGGEKRNCRESPPFFKRGYDSTRGDVLDTLEYWIQLAGIDHVSIGRDFTENQSEEWFHWLMAGKRKDTVYPLQLPLKLPQGIERADQFPNITAGLVDRGYTAESIQKILGLNVLRLFERVWKQ